MNSNRSLQYANPNLAKEWHPTRNGDLMANMVMPNSNKKVWWLGECGHEWEAIVGVRNRGAKCPICSSRQTLTGFNDIKTRYPELQDEWDYDKNTILPEKV